MSHLDKNVSFVLMCNHVEFHSQYQILYYTRMAHTEWERRECGLCAHSKEYYDLGGGIDKQTINLLKLCENIL